MHSFKDEPEFIYCEINKDGFETKKIEIFKNKDFIIYSESINSDRLTEGLFPSLDLLNFQNKEECLKTIEIDRSDFYKVWNSYLNRGTSG